MPSGRSLTPAENERVLAAIRDLLAKPGENQSTVAPLLGIKQPTLSAMLAGRHQAGYALARRVAARLGVAVDDLLGAESDAIGPALEHGTGIGRIPNWDEAAQECLRRYPWVERPMVARAALIQGVDAPNPMTPEYVLEAVKFVTVSASMRSDADAGRSAVAAEIRAHKRDTERRAKGKRTTGELPIGKPK